MKTEANWDDMVFENRHKEYGAYSIRQAYPRHAAIGFATIATVALLILFLPGLLPKSVAVIVPPIPEIMHPTTNLQREPRIVNPKPQQQAAAVKGENHQPYRVTRDEVAEAPPTTEQLANSVSSAKGEEGSTDGAVDFSEGTVGSGESDIPAVPAVDMSKPFDIVEHMPAYEGGMEAMAKYISRHMHYPASARRMGLEGTVYVSFVISASGGVTDVKVVRGISAECDNEAVRVISGMPAWKAGIQNGTAVPVRMVLPIKFAFSH